MKPFLLALPAACVLGLLVRTLGADSTPVPESEHILTTLPEGNGRLRLSANSINREWNTSVVHLSGNVQVEIWTSTKNPGYATFIRADQVDYFEKTGELSPRGNVRINIAQAK